MPIAITSVDIYLLLILTATRRLRRADGSTASRLPAPVTIAVTGEDSYLLLISTASGCRRRRRLATATGSRGVTGCRRRWRADKIASGSR